MRELVVDRESYPVRVCRTGYTGEHGYEVLPRWADTRRYSRRYSPRSPPAMGCQPVSGPATRCAPRWATRYWT